MADENRVIGNRGNRCPDCGGLATHPRYDAHPAASKLRNAAYWSVPIGFVACGLFLLASLTHLGIGIGFNLAAIALAPAAALVTASYFYPRVWLTTCGGCRKTFYRLDREESWRTVPRA